MSAPTRYGQFCPVAMAAEILCCRWTVPVLRELLCGSTRFNELRKGVPRMSPALLAQRLRDLERAGIVRRVELDGGGPEYRLTRAGEELRDVVEAIGFWGQRWIDAEISLRNLDAQLLMWDMRRNLDPRPVPDKRAVIQFLYPEQTPRRRSWWLIVDGGEVDLCSIEPGFEVDLYVVTDLRTMTKIWMGLTEVEAEVGAGRVTLTGDRTLARLIREWLGLSPFARATKEEEAAVALRLEAAGGGAA